MTRTATATLAAVLSLSAGLALPVAAGADGGGGTAAPEPGATGPGGSAPGLAQPAGSGDLRAGRAAFLGRRQRIAGTLEGAGSGREVVVQRSDREEGWVTIARTETDSGGKFAAIWKADRIGRFTLRALPAGAASSASAESGLTAEMTVYRPAIATHYGPGWYGSKTACGTILRPGTVGVAHKTLPCGTLVEFSYRGRTVRAPVIDRGPYANNAKWDLTIAASRALRFNGKDYVGAIRVGKINLNRAR